MPRRHAPLFDAMLHCEMCCLRRLRFACVMRHATPPLLLRCRNEGAERCCHAAYDDARGLLPPYAATPMLRAAMLAMLSLDARATRLLPHTIAA